MTDKIQLELTVNEVNTILTALAELPYRAVNELVKNVVKQAESQLNQDRDNPVSYTHLTLPTKA